MRPILTDPEIAARDRLVGAVIVLAAALLFYAATAYAVGHTSTDVVYFQRLADAFLHGRLDIGDQHGQHDLTEFNGRWYVPFPPLPALVMLPWVAAFGVERTNPVWFSIVLGSANAALVWLLVSELARREVALLSRGARIGLTFMFAIGSAHWYMAVEGSVWFIAQVSAFTFAALSAWMAIAGRGGWVCGAALALAMLGRPNMLALWPLLAGLAAHASRDAGDRFDGRRWRRWAASSAVPLAVSLALLGGYNQARFGSPFDFGYEKQNVDAELYNALYTHGVLSIQHIPRNLHVMLLATPTIPRGRSIPVPDDHGMSMLLATPALLWLVFSRPRRDIGWGALAALTLSLAPLLLYYNTGWRQFGYRFSLDFFVVLIVLAACALSRRQSGAFAWLVAAGVAVNLYGLIWWFTDFGYVPPADLFG